MASASQQLPTGTVIIHPPKAAPSTRWQIYARISSADQKADLERQLGRLSARVGRRDRFEWPGGIIRLLCDRSDM